MHPAEETSLLIPSARWIPGGRQPTFTTVTPTTAAVLGVAVEVAHLLRSLPT